jgi:hypothetical protein
VSALSDHDAEAVAGPVAVPRGNGVGGSALARVRVAVPSANGVGGSPCVCIAPPGCNKRACGHLFQLQQVDMELPSGTARPAAIHPRAATSDEQVRQKLLTVLRQMCNCGKRRERRGQRPGAKPQPLRMHCTTRLQNHLEECVEHRLALCRCTITCSSRSYRRMAVQGRCRLTVTVLVAEPHGRRALTRCMCRASMCPDEYSVSDYVSRCA